MPSKLREISIAALAVFALTSGPALAASWSWSSEAPIHEAQFSFKPLKQLKRPIILPPNPCKKQACARPRPR
jgi:hypothetical protein